MISGMETNDNRFNPIEATAAWFSRTNKTPEMESALEDMGQELFGRSRKFTGENQLCIACGNDANHFRDELSQKEYSISRMCQGCQDQVFS
jgi:hypothetical protein